jgi:hypothetical protein
LSEGPRAIDRLVAIAVDAGQPQALRLAAIEALSDIPGRTIQPIWRRLIHDQDPRIARRGRLALGLDWPDPEPSDVLDAASTGTARGSQLLRTAIAAAGGDVPLPTLHRVLEALRASERDGRQGARLVELRGTRAALHEVLAARGSSVALYDARETLEDSSAPLPVEFVTALAIVGDRTCLDAIAGAYARAPGAQGSQDWWRAHLATAFREIVRREGLTERHAALKHVRSKWPEAARALLGPRRSRR